MPPGIVVDHEIPTGSPRSFNTESGKAKPAEKSNNKPGAEIGSQSDAFRTACQAFIS